MSTAFQTDAFQSNAWQIAAGTGEAPVEVPNVVGESQGDGTATLEGAGFSVSVTEFYSVQPVGQIIAQSPVGGSFALPGAMVSIFVSRGPEPSSAVGGWPAPPRRKKKRPQEAPEEADEVPAAPAEAPTAIAVALERALTKTKVGDRVAEKAAQEFAVSLVARRQQQNAERLRLEQEIQKRIRTDEETVVRLILSRYRSKRPA